jgi:hypothetical protein
MPRKTADGSGQESIQNLGGVFARERLAVCWCVTPASLPAVAARRVEPREFAVRTPRRSVCRTPTGDLARPCCAAAWMPPRQPPGRRRYVPNGRLSALRNHFTASCPLSTRISPLDFWIDPQRLLQRGPRPRHTPMPSALGPSFPQAAQFLRPAACHVMPGIDGSCERVVRRLASGHLRRPSSTNPSPTRAHPPNLLASKLQQSSQVPLDMNKSPAAEVTAGPLLLWCRE